MAEERDFEAEARADGWAPKEDWRGDPDKWKTAEDFVKAGENILPIVKSKMEKFEKELSESRETNKKFNEFFKDYKSREKKEKDGLRRELEELKKTAVTEGDGEAFMKADQQLSELDEPEPSQELSPEAQTWLQSNDWYGKKENLTVFADGVSDRLVAQGYTHGSPAYFQELTNRVKDSFPDDFGNRNRNKPNGVETGGEKETSGSKKQTYENLPKDAQVACDEFVRDIPGFKKEDYLASFDWETGNV